MLAALEAPVDAHKDDLHEKLDAILTSGNDTKIICIEETIEAIYARVYASDDMAEDTEPTS